MIVYLSGGMSTGNNWQDVVKKQCSRFNFVDPRTHGLLNPKEYTEWDLNGVEKSDIVFAFMDKDNPSGFGLSLEVGYAKGLNKIIIMSDEQFKPSMKIVRCCADYLYDNLNDGINKLNEIYKQLRRTT
jgi:nucleoside 2-deoxyribosyltransferase